MIDFDEPLATDSDDDAPSVTIDLRYFQSLLIAKRELRQLRASLSATQPTQGYDPGLPDAAEYLSTDHPDLIDYSGMTTAQAMDMHPELFDYDLYERDC